MNGEVLKGASEGGEGVILGDDGKRYTFSSGEGELRVGAKVNFEVVEENKAKGVLAIASQNSMMSSAGLAGIADGNSPKASGTLGAIGAGISVLGLIPFIGFLFALVGYVVQIIAIKKLSDYVKRPDIFWGFIVSLLSAFLGALAGTLVFGLSLFAGSVLDSLHAVGIGGVVGLLVAVGLFIYGAYRQFKALTAIADCYSIAYFRYAAWTYVVASLTMIIGIGFLLLIVYLIMMILGFLAMRNSAVSTKV